jgi:16S rRNA processing protein RimM
MHTERFVVGLVGAPFGVKGFVKIHSLSGEYEHLARLESVILRKGEDERPMYIEETAPVHQALNVKFRGIDSPEAARTLSGAELITSQEHAAPLDTDEFYIEDLRGLEVHVEGKAVGHITSICEGGGGHLVEVRLGEGSLRLVPFRHEFFGDIDLEAGRAVLLEPWILE